MANCCYCPKYCPCLVSQGAGKQSVVQQLYKEVRSCALHYLPHPAPQCALVKAGRCMVKWESPSVSLLRCLMKVMHWKEPTRKLCWKFLQLQFTGVFPSSCQDPHHQRSLVESGRTYRMATAKSHWSMYAIWVSTKFILAQRRATYPPKSNNYGVVRTENITTVQLICPSLNAGMIHLA